jgi:hypothetical protein
MTNTQRSTSADPAVSDLAALQARVERLERVLHALVAQVIWYLPVDSPDGVRMDADEWLSQAMQGLLR